MSSAVEKIQKFFKLEIERGYDNRAVVGGLDKILPAWEKEARLNQLDAEIIQVVTDGLKAYPSLEPQQRAEILSALFARLENIQPARPLETARAEPRRGPSRLRQAERKRIAPPGQARRSRKAPGSLRANRPRARSHLACRTSSRTDHSQGRRAPGLNRSPPGLQGQKHIRTILPA